jgi:hypothetical protein
MWLECEVDYSPPPNAEIKKGEDTSNPPICLCGILFSYISTGTTLPLHYLSHTLNDHISLITLITASITILCFC